MSTNNSTLPTTTVAATTTAPTTPIPTTTSAVTTDAATTPATTTQSTTEAPPPTTTTAAPPTTAAETTPSAVPTTAPTPSTELITSIITQSAGPGQSSIPPVTVIITSEITPTASDAQPTTDATSTSATTRPTTQPNGDSAGSSGGLAPAGRTAIAVVVPIVAVILIVLAALFFWRKRKQRKNAEEARRKEVEEYGYNPNQDPTLPVIAADGRSEMAEDHGNGYRGWGTAMGARKPSTTLSGGQPHAQLSDSGSAPGGFSQSATAYDGSDAPNGDVYQKQRDTMTSDDLAALGAAPAASSNANNMRRGPSNASSSYSAGHRSDHSDPDLHQRTPSEGAISPQNYNAYNTAGPYGDGTYGGGDGMPVVRDVSARRHTKIEQGGAYQQGNSGISQNF